MTNHSPSSEKIEKSSSKETQNTTSYIAHWLARLVYPLGRYLVLPLFFGHIEVIGRENVPRTGSVLLAPTHRSRWDPIILGYAAGRYITGRDLRFMVTSDEMTGVQGWFVRRLGGFPINTKHPSLGTIRHSVDLLRKGEMLVIFPEGNIMRDKPVQPLKSGVARIALQAQSHLKEEEVKIVPISIRYSQAYPTWGTDVQICLGKPLSVVEYSHDGVKQQSQKIMVDLESSLKELYEHKSLEEDCLPAPTA